jgi:hypothetical protein
MVLGSSKSMDGTNIRDAEIQRSEGRGLRGSRRGFKAKLGFSCSGQAQIRSKMASPVRFWTTIIILWESRIVIGEE